MNTAEKVMAYASMYQRLKASMQQLQDAYKETMASEYQMSHLEGWQTITTGINRECDPEKGLKQSMRHIAAAVTDMAAREFAPAGVDVLTIDASDYEEFKTDPETFDPFALWEALEKDLGGEGGEDAGYREAACDLVREFRIRSDTPVKRTKGRIVLNLNVSISEWSRTNDLTYPAARDVDTIFRALRAICAYAGRPGLIGHDFFRRPIISRENLDISEDIQLITYYTRFEFRFTEDFFADMQAFIGRYGAEALARNAAVAG
jgi:hypothetical protein